MPSLAGLCGAGVGPTERGRAQKMPSQQLPVGRTPRWAVGWAAHPPRRKPVNPVQLLPCLFMDLQLGANWAQSESARL